MTKRHLWAHSDSVWFFVSSSLWRLCLYDKKKVVFGEINCQQDSLYHECLTFHLPPSIDLGRVGWAVIGGCGACKPWRKELGPSCEWFSLEIGALDKSSSLAHVIIVKALLPILNMRTYLSLTESQGESYNTWIFLDMNCTYISLHICMMMWEKLYLNKCSSSVWEPQ